MRVLVACESSGTVRNAFMALGHNAWSCDILPADDHSFFHYQCSVIDVLQKKNQWDLIIAHPPCTALCVAGNSTYGEGQPKWIERVAAVEWTKDLWNRCIWAGKRVCFENPVGVLQRLGGFHKPQYIQPYMFGHMEQKKTGLWLYNLPELVETNNVYEAMKLLPKAQQQRIHYLPPSADRWKIRSKTFEGIADAMANQWGAL